MRFRVLLLTPLLAATAGASEPAICEEVIAANGGDPLVALAEAEQERFRAVRELQRETRKLGKKTLGRGGTGVLGIVGQIDETTARQLATLREARALCGCREARGDPHRRDCNTLYAEWLPPEPVR